MRGKFRLDGRKNVKTNSGFPIVIYLTKDKKEKLILTGYHSKKEHWDKANALPKKKHPDYFEIINYLEKKKIILSKLLDGAKLDPINLHIAEKLLLQNDTDIFYKEGLKVQGSRTYNIALNSFNKYFPDYEFSMIDKSLVKRYLDILLNTPNGTKKRSPNGVISYMNTLTAIWNKLEKPNNPFSGVRPKAIKTKSKVMSDADLIKIRDNDYKGSISDYLNYFMLCFYLGGIDLIDLANLKHSNIINGRVEFNRTKGGTDVFVSNKVFPEAQKILDKYNDLKYLVPLHKTYKNYTSNISRVLPKIQEKLNLSKLPYSKAPRYTFITRAQSLLIDERITREVVGHSQTSIHSIYTDEFPYHVRDKAHEKIIKL